MDDYMHKLRVELPDELLKKISYIIPAHPKEKDGDKLTSMEAIQCTRIAMKYAEQEMKRQEIQFIAILKSIITDYHKLSPSEFLKKLSETIKLIQENV